MFKLIAKALKPRPSQKQMQTIIETIHNEFDTAGEKLLAEANEVLNGSYDIEKGERLKKLGFSNSKSAVDADTIKEMRAKKKKEAETVEYFRTYYPNNKFITAELVESICKKYDLVFGDIRYYKGDVPEKNITEMENFKLRDEDKDDEYSYEAQRFLNDANDIVSRSALQNLGGLGAMERMQSQRRPHYNYIAKPTGRKIQHGFKICAPESDFDMTHMMRTGHKIELHIPDPIVLQPVDGGFLIVSKWGLEADDAELANEKMN